MSRTYTDQHAPRAVAAAFLVVSLVVVLIPFVGMAWARTDATTENRTLAPAPALWDEGGQPNVDVLADAGAYFDDHFAYRNLAVAANAHVRALFGASATDQVIVGSDDWLYYGGTLNDYLGRSALSERSLANIAHNLKTVQGYVRSKGAAFAFTVAPNKNTLYDQHMPAYFLRSPDPSNAQRLVAHLEREEVAYVDLFDLFSGDPETRYLKRDTHWDNRGALVAAYQLLGACGHLADLPDAASAVECDDFVGDLQDMLYPGENRTEPNSYYAGYHQQADSQTPLKWSYAEGSDVTDNWVRTTGQGAGSLLMFRDSFGNALLPFVAASCEQAAFSKLVPYNVPLVSKVEADAVVIERAERHLADLAVTPPIVPCPKPSQASGVLEGATEVPATVSSAQDGPYLVVSGSVDADLEPTTQLYLVIQSGDGEPVVYDPYWTSSANDNGEVIDDRGFLAYLNASNVDADSLSVRAFVK